MKLQAVSNRKLYIQIADQIRDLIQSGAAEPGRQLPSERDLAQDLGVSRPTVREALIALEVAGLIDIRVGVGAFVRGRNGGVEPLPEQNHSPIEVMQARCIIEPEVAALAARHIDTDQIAALNEILTHMRVETAAGRWPAASDQALHLTIADACASSVLREILSDLWKSRAEEVDQRFHTHLASIDELRRHIMVDHEAIVAAIERGDPDAARKAMTDHLRYVEAAMLSVWD
ncbi:FadR/GntR family transcriptional regulator [Devosia nitrariae]|uniref:GntR family transcriptional regulator n=1 Tax=Devosia nitrariae TaxID=2071872 RepID=A0ABQ5W0W9_9HYPH|nr:FadR/GntR family transcriptional regulator [Devosia nitrariae]GLQ53363.1 GntR family transcriptional regulator [Devosia nitrariae]